MFTKRTDMLTLTAALVLLDIGKAISSDQWEDGTFIVLGDDGEFIDELGDVVAIECSNVNDTWYLVERITEVTDACHLNV